MGQLRYICLREPQEEFLVATYSDFLNAAVRDYCASTGATQDEVVTLQACHQLLLIFMPIFELHWKPSVYINLSSYQWHAFKQASLINPFGTSTLFKGSSDILFYLQEWKDSEIRKKSLQWESLHTRDSFQLQAINLIKYFLAWH